jgi:hypothetical protein
VSGTGNSQALSIRSGADTESSTCAITDSVADASTRDQAFEVAPYQDIVEASITRLDSRFVLEMGVAAPIPGSPALGRGVHLLDWTFRFDTDPSTTPRGFPWSPGDHIHGAEYLVIILWDGTRFNGTLVDRTPLLAGQEAVVTPIDFHIDGSEIIAFVDAAGMGDPSSVRMRATRTSGSPSLEPTRSFSRMPPQTTASSHGHAT